MEEQEKRQHRFQATGERREIRKRVKILKTQEGNSEKNHFKRERVYQHPCREGHWEGHQGNCRDLHGNRKVGVGKWAGQDVAQRENWSLPRRGH